MNKKIIIIGLGNPILGDDGIGYRVIEKFQQGFSPPLWKNSENNRIDIDYLSVGGIGLMENLVGYDFAIIVDAIQTNTQSQGSVVNFSINDLQNISTMHSGSTHDMNFTTAIKMGREMGLKLPEEIFIVGIEARSVYDFSDQLSKEVEQSIPTVEKKIYEILDLWEKLP
jgi:hydrogenase maturation protease